MSEQRINVDLTDLDNLEVDFSKASQVPSGELLLRVDKIDLKRSSNDNRMLLMGLRIVGGEFDGRYINDNWMLEPEESLFKTRKAFRAFLGGEQNESFHVDNEVLESLLDTEAWCLVIPEKGKEGTAYEGESFPRVKKYGIATPEGEATF